MSLFVSPSATSLAMSRSLFVSSAQRAFAVSPSSTAPAPLRLSKAVDAITARSRSLSTGF